MTAILGISAFFHDSAAAVVVDGRVVAAAQEERFSRIKHDPAFPIQSIEYCLSAAGIDAGDLDLVAFYEKPLAKFDRLIDTYLNAAPRGFRSFATAMPSWLEQKLHVRKQIRKQLGRRYTGPIGFWEHHQSHAASAFYPSPFDEAAIITMDGVGEWATSTWGVGRGRSIELSHQIEFPDSIGLLYSAFTYHAGFRVNSGEYKLMGLAPYGRPRFVDLIRDELIDIRDDGSFRLSPEYFDYQVGLTMTSVKFDQLFGRSRRDPDAPIEPFDQDMAASIQVVLEEVVMKTARHVHQVTGQTKLCMAGGVALNCVANGKLLREGPFDDVWVQPASGDAGGAIGAALLGWYDVFEKERDSASLKRCDALLGPEFDANVVEAAIQRHGLSCEVVSDDQIAGVVATELAAGKVIGRFAGRMEFGPRALGNRSILADPRGVTTQSRINQKIKFRESFRPFAPAVLADQAEDWFDCAGHADSPYMMFVHPVRSNILRIPAVTHVDGSARVQTVDAIDNPSFEQLLRSFFEATGCPMLVNTSFNVRGEPIVASPDDALRCYLKTDMDVLVIENFIVRSKEVSSPPVVEDSAGERQPRFMAARRAFRLWNRILGTAGMGAVYYGVITPIGILRRFRKAPLLLLTYWKSMPICDDPDRFFRTY
ncbi:carbamoyltransferase family protein [Rubripirellula reticaptiva]|nr:carbamoyltransferase [Rubripirellula reticaptiva]